MALTPTAVERIAQAIHALRPQWPITTLETFLRDPKLANRPVRDVAIALTWIAVDPNTRTPARVHEDGPWWKAATVDETPTYRNPGTQCTIHPGQLEPCRHCTAQRSPADPTPHTQHPALQLARAQLHSVTANTCPHGILKGHGKCRDCQPTHTTAPAAAKSAEPSTPNTDPGTAPTDQPTPHPKPTASGATPNSDQPTGAHTTNTPNTEPTNQPTHSPPPTGATSTAPDSPPVESR